MFNSNLVQNDFIYQTRGSIPKLYAFTMICKDNMCYVSILHTDNNLWMMDFLLLLYYVDLMQNLVSHQEHATNYAEIEASISFF
jgi:hypothetical protein